jgi:GMP synthase-like glutamine amidotransferase
VTRVGILEAGRPSDAIIRRHGNFSEMFCKYFSGQPELEFSVFPVAFGAPIPKPSDRDAWIITGSSAAVYEDHPWLPPMREFVRQSIGQSIPTLGICFGHQLMAQAFGGKVTKSDKGRAAGIHQYTLSQAGQKLAPDKTGINLIATHQDQVIEPPPNAVLMASSEFCSYAALGYGDAGLSLQPHPEFTIDSARDIVRGWQERSPVAEEIIVAAESSFNAIAPDSERLLPILRNFLIQRHPS